MPISVDIDGWKPAEVEDYDDAAFLQAEENLAQALHLYIEAGARPDNLVEVLERVLGEE